MFVLLALVPINYKIQAEYLLKKKTLNGLEAIAASQKVENNSQEQFTIEPFFYSLNIFEKAVVHSAFQITQNPNGLIDRISRNLSAIIKTLLKEEIERSFTFKNCVYDSYKKSEFAIRRLGDHHLEVLYQNNKSLHDLGSKIVLKDFSFDVEKVPKTQFKWYSFKVQPLQKAVSKAKGCLKIRPEKNSKSSLFFQFFCHEKSLGEIFLDSFIRFSELEAELVKKKTVSVEINALNKKIDQIENLSPPTTSKEEISIFQRDLLEFSEKLKLLDTKKSESSGFLEKLTKIYEKKLVLEEFSNREFSLIQKKTQLLKQPSNYQKNIYSSLTLEFLEKLLLESTHSTKKIQETLIKLDSILDHRFKSSWIFFDYSQSLNELFLKKRNLEAFSKNKAISEIQENANQLKEIEHLIDLEVEYLKKEIKHKAQKEAEFQSLIKDAIGFRSFQEYESLKNEYFENLLFKIEDIKTQISDLDHEMVLGERARLNKMQELRQKALEADRLKKIMTQKEDLENKLIKKELEHNTQYFFGTILYPAKASNFPDVQFRFFIVLMSSLILALGYISLDFMNALTKGILPSKDFFSKVGLVRLSLDTFKQIKEKKLLVTNKKFAAIFNKNLPVKTFDQFKSEDFQIYSKIGIDQDLMHIDQLEFYLLNKASLCFVKSDVF